MPASFSCPISECLVVTNTSIGLFCAVQKMDIDHTVSVNQNVCCIRVCFLDFLSAHYCLLNNLLDKTTDLS